MNKTCLSYWYPRVNGLVPTPATIILRTDAELYKLPYGEGDQKEITAFHQLCRDVEEAARQLGYPVFLRTGLTSGKHSWRDTCYLDKPEDTADHIISLIWFSEMAGLLGLPTDVWVIRQFLRAEPAFHAFSGMPITREFRYFVRYGEITHKQPYWPPEAIEDSRRPDCEDWRTRLNDISKVGDDDAELSRMTSIVGYQLGGYWSVDWLWAEGQWWLTDMAEGEKSFRWEPPAGTM